MTVEKMLAIIFRYWIQCSLHFNKLLTIEFVKNSILKFIEIIKVSRIE